MCQSNYNMSTPDSKGIVNIMISHFRTAESINVTFKIHLKKDKKYSAQLNHFFICLEIDSQSVTLSTVLESVLFRVLFL